MEWYAVVAKHEAVRHGDSNIPPNLEPVFVESQEKCQQELRRLESERAALKSRTTGRSLTLGVAIRLATTYHVAPIRIVIMPS